MSNKQNIIFIFTDQQRRDFLGCYGSEIVKTPNIDMLAADGTVFDNAYTVYPVCTPARASLQTGLYPCNHGMQNNMYQPGCVVHELPDTPNLLSRRLGNLGYTAGHTGKWHLGYGSRAHNDPWYDDHCVESSVNTVEYPSFYTSGSCLPTDLGYEGDDFPGHGGGGHEYQQYQDYLQENGLEHILSEPKGGIAEVLSPKESTIDYFLTQRAMHYIEKFKKRKNPFFFELNYWGPHMPAYVPTEFLDRFKNMSFSPWQSFNESQEDKPKIHNIKRGGGNWAAYENKLRYVYAYHEFIDHEIGRLIDYLKDEDLYDSSYIIMSCDHGDSLGCHSGLGDKGFHMYEETTHIPLIVKPPKGTSHAKNISEFANTTDIYSTILDIAGTPTEKSTVDGNSLLPLILEQEIPNWTDCAVTEFTGLGYAACSQRMLRYENYKYVFNLGDKEELYDLDNDPYELTNLYKSKKHQVILQKLKDKLYLWLKEHKDGFANDFLSYTKACANNP